jgi:toluene monooxygenase system protein D
MAELEVNLGSFAGRIETSNDYVRFYYEKTI